MIKNALTLDNVSISYGGNVVIRDCHFNLTNGRILSLLGASGCGKSTLLKAIAGILPLQQGTISLNGDILSKPNWHLSPEKRSVGMIFQDYALFPHLTVAQNIAFGLHKISKEKRHIQVEKGLSLVQLKNFSQRYPHELSGGQQQRVAIARALVCQPKILLFDEPFSNLDIAVRESLMHEIKHILKRQQITAIFVTHDKNEAFAMADDIAVMKEGKIAQFGVGKTVYDKPNSRYVAEFLGHGTSLLATPCNGGWQTAIGVISSSQKGQVLWLNEAGKTYAYLRPHQLYLEENSQANAFINTHYFRGDWHFYIVDLDGNFVQLLSQKRIKIGARVALKLQIS